MSGITLCWKCRHAFAIEVARCPKCNATNANHDLETAEAEMGLRPETVYEKSARWNWPDGRADMVHLSTRAGSGKDIGGDAVVPFSVALNTRHPDCHRAADAFWKYWKENGETHKHGYYESTWGAINRAIRMVGVAPHDYGQPERTTASNPAVVPASRSAGASEPNGNSISSKFFALRADRDRLREALSGAVPMLEVTLKFLDEELPNGAHMPVLTIAREALRLSKELS